MEKVVSTKQQLQEIQGASWVKWSDKCAGLSNKWTTRNWYWKNLNWWSDEAPRVNRNESLESCKSKKLSSPRRRLSCWLPTKDIEKLSMTKRKFHMSEGAKNLFWHYPTSRLERSCQRKKQHKWANVTSKKKVSHGSSERCCQCRWCIVLMLQPSDSEHLSACT